MSRGAVELHQDVVVIRVTGDGEEVEVDVFGGDPAVIGTVSYRFPDQDERKAQLATLTFWERESTRLVYVRRDGEVALMDDEARFQDAWSQSVAEVD
ncbi:MAG: hypothetical protein QOE35_2117 [Actinomycetota bacterium]|jgi:hypothetical protein